MNSKLKINEIFYSIQGESTFLGLPCTFIRLTGCNLRCSWCDTVYAYEEGQDMEIDEIIREISKYPLNLVEITGGEPLLQEQTPALCEKILETGATVLIETNGSLDISVLPEKVIRIMDVKCPGSGEVDSNNWNNMKHLNLNDQAKFVIADRTDFDWALTIVEQYQLLQKCNVLFAPVHGVMPLPDLAEWIVRSQKPIRLQPQLHKLIWGPDKRGV